MSSAFGLVIFLTLGCGGDSGGHSNLSTLSEPEKIVTEICRFGPVGDKILSDVPGAFYLNQPFPIQSETDRREAAPFYNPNPVPTEVFGSEPVSYSRFYREFVMEMNAVNGSLFEHPIDFAQVLWDGIVPIDVSGDAFRLALEEVVWSQSSLWTECPAGQVNPLSREPYLSFVAFYSLPDGIMSSEVGTIFQAACVNTVTKEIQHLTRNGRVPSVSEVQESLEVFQAGNALESMPIRVARIGDFTC